MVRDRVENVVAPLPSVTQELWTSLGDYALILYPYAQGTTGMESGLSERQWAEYGAILQRIHATAIAPDLAQVMNRESFAPEWAGTVRALDTHIGEHAFSDPAARELAEFWKARQERIRTLVDRAESLG